MSSLVEIAHNIERVRERIALACQSVGRSADEVTLVAVSKTMPIEVICQAMEAGITDLGENRVEEAVPKMRQLTDPRWHMIGHVQSRKAEDVVAAGFHLVHSLDSLKLAQRYDRFAKAAECVLPVLLEINVSGEASKEGWLAVGWEKDGAVRDNLWQWIEALLALPNLRIEGLMTMAPYETEPEATRSVFQDLARLREALRTSFKSLSWRHLSMGMTNDFEVAIQEGATIVRVGRAIFGERRIT